MEDDELFRRYFSDDFPDVFLRNENHQNAKASECVGIPLESGSDESDDFLNRQNLSESAIRILGQQHAIRKIIGKPSDLLCQNAVRTRQHNSHPHHAHTGEKCNNSSGSGTMGGKYSCSCKRIFNT